MNALLILFQPSCNRVKAWLVFLASIRELGSRGSINFLPCRIILLGTLFYKACLPADEADCLEGFQAYLMHAPESTERMSCTTSAWPARNEIWIRFLAAWLRGHLCIQPGRPRWWFGQPNGMCLHPVSQVGWGWFRKSIITPIVDTILDRKWWKTVNNDRSILYTGNDWSFKSLIRCWQKLEYQIFYEKRFHSPHPTANLLTSLLLPHQWVCCILRSSLVIFI